MSSHKGDDDDLTLSSEETTSVPETCPQRETETNKEKAYN